MYVYALQLNIILTIYPIKKRSRTKLLVIKNRNFHDINLDSLTTLSVWSLDLTIFINQYFYLTPAYSRQVGPR